MSVNLSVDGRVRGLSLAAVVVQIAVFFIFSALPGELSAADAGARQAYSVDVSGDLAVVGASWEDGYGGAAYVLRRDGDGWTVEQRLVPSDLGPYDHFGGSVSIDGDRITVTSPWHDLQRGASYAFRKDGDTWVQDSKIPASREAVAGKLAANMLLSGGQPQGDVLPAGALDLIEAIESETGSTPPLAAPAALIAPSWVSATDSIFEDRVEITWENTGQQNILYKVHRDGTLLSFVAADVYSYSDETVTIGQTERYCVVATDMVAEETDSTCDNGTRIIFNPTAFVASDGQYFDGVHLSWIDLSSINDGYVIYRDEVPIDSTGADATSFVDTTVAPGRTPYIYKITAYVDGGFESEAISETGWRAEKLPPQSVSATDGQYLDRVVVTWIGPDDELEALETTGYKIYRSGTFIGSTADGVETFIDSTAVFGNLYNYCVAAVGTGDIESIRICDPGNAGLATPGNVSASDSTFDDRVQITWEDLSDHEDGYEIVRDTYVASGIGKNDTRPIVMASPDSVVVGTVGADTEVFDDMTAEPGVTYLYYVRAFSDEGGISLAGEDTGYRSIVLAPTGVQASDGDYEDRTYITWESASTTAVAFMVLRDGVLAGSIEESQKYFNDTGGVAGQDYDYSVKAVTAMGDISKGASDTGRRELVAPTPVTATDDEFEDRVVISWADNSAVEDGYRVYRKLDTDAGTLLGSFDTPDYAQGAAVAGDYAYVADRDSGLQVIDISDPSNPVFAGSVDTPGEARGVAVAGDYAYVADQASGLQVIDISIPSSPSIIGSVDTPGSAMGIAIAGKYAYLAADNSGLLVIDISHPSDPTIVGSFEEGSVHGVAVNGNYAYLCLVDAPYGLQVIDISNPSNPEMMGSVETDFVSLSVAVSGDYAYLVDISYGLWVVDISNPLSPTKTGGVATPGGSWGVAVAGDYAYVADRGSGLQVINISDPANPVIEGSVDTPDDALYPAIAGGYAFVADGGSGLQVIGLYGVLIDAIEPNRTSLVDYSAVSGVPYVYSVAAYDITDIGAGESATAADEGVRTLIAPTSAGATDGAYEDRVEITWRDNSSAEDGYYIYRDGDSIGTEADNSISFIDYLPDLGIHHEYSVAAFDAVGPSAAAVDSGFTTILAPVAFNASDAYEDRVEMTWVDQSELEEGFRIYRDGMLIQSIGSNVTSFTYGVSGIRGYIDTPGEARAVAVAGDYAYVGDGDSLHIINVSDPAAPTMVSALHLGSSYVWSISDIAVESGYAYGISRGSFPGDGLQVIDISDPATPVVVGNYSFYNGECVAINGQYAYAGEYEGGVHIIDISDPEDPVLVRVCPGLTPQDITLAGDFAYIAADSDGLHIFDISEPDTLVPVGSYDTPGYARDVAIAGNYAFVADSDAGLQIINISYPAAPTLAGTYDTPGSAIGLAITGDYACIANIEFGLQYINISDPSTPTLARAYSTPGEAYGIAIAGDLAYVGDGSSGLQIFSNPLIDAGSPYEYCVEAYEGDIASESTCDNGTMLLKHTEVTATYVFLKLLASDGVESDRFGASVSISGDRAIVGARLDDDNGSSSGSAYIFERDAGGVWTETQKLVASDGAASDYFGNSVSINGTRAIIGAFCDDDRGSRSGSAYIFERDAGGTWTETTKLLASDGAVDDRFGHCVSINGDRAIVGAPYDDLNHSNSGSAYIFERDTGGIWVQMPKLSRTLTETDTFFGWSVSIDGDRAIVGGHCDDGTLNIDQGAAWIFERDGGGTWAQSALIVATDRASYDEFGYSVSISGDRAVIGAHMDDDNGYNSGSAYIFERNAGGTWSSNETQKLIPSDGFTNHNFGCSVSISGDRVIVGARADATNGTFAGSAYMFERDDAGLWVQTQKLLAGDGDVTYFGTSVSIAEDRAIIGTVFEPDMPQGIPTSAYILDIASPPDAVAASDGTLESRVRVTWEDNSFNERGFRIYRDGEPIASVEPNVQGYEDYDAESGRTYQYSVATLTNDVSNESEQIADFGWRPANGNITGRISTVEGAASDSIWIAVTPLQTKALLFDGNGGHVSVPDKAGKLNFNSAKSYTIETWIKYAGDGGLGSGDGTMIARAAPASGSDRYPFLLSNMRAAGEPGQLRFVMSDNVDSVEVLSDSTDFNDNSWHHVACVHDAAHLEIKLYIDGALQGSVAYVSLGDITNAEPVTLGAGPESGSWFGGQLDEVRIWNIARADSAIQAMMRRPLDGDEEGLVAYWPLDDVINGIITDLTEGAHYGTFEGGVYLTDNCAQLDVHPVTDIEGNYVLKGLYYGTEAEFEVKPFSGSRQFDPPVKRVVLTTESPVENQVNFVDVSSFTVSGTIRFAGTECGSADIPILVDGQPAGATDKNGKFAVSVDLGEHSIRPDFEGHTFEPDSLVLSVDGDVVVNDPSGEAFSDLTTYTLSGSLGGGCGRFIGNITLAIRSENSCFQETLSFSAGDTAFSRALPPQNYLVSASVDSIASGLHEIDVMEFFQNLGVRVAEMDTTDVEMNFVYRAPLVVTIEGFDAPECQQLSIDGVQLPPGLPVIEQFEYVTITINVGEDYGSGEICKLDTGTVTIYDEIFDQENTPFTVPVSDGVAEYTTFASTPSLLSGRVDADGNNRSYQKAITFYASAEGIEADPVTEWVLVTGHVAQEGAEFVTFAGSVEPKYILRDPPGDNSYAYLREGYTSCAVEDFDMLTWTNGAGVALNIKWGLKQSFFIGLGAGTSKEIEVKRTDSYKLSGKRTSSINSKTKVCLSFEEQFSTASSDLFTGGSGDVFIGAGTNYILAKVNVIDIEGCDVTRTPGIGIEPEGFHTTFAYTEQYVSDVLIPELDSTVVNYMSIGEPDSADLYRVARDDWQAMLDLNDGLKASAQLSENRSFSAGADYEYSYSEVTTESYVEKVTLLGSLDRSHGAQAEIFGNDYKLTVSKSNSVSGVTDLTDTTGTETQTVGYVLSDDDIGDNFTVDVKNDGTYPSPVFDVLAGVSSCPWEPWRGADGEARMVPRDGTDILCTDPDATEVPPDQPAVFKLDLVNTSENDEARLYTLRLVSTSNPDGAAVKVNGALLNSGLPFFLEPNEPHQVTLTVERGPSRYTYNGLQVMLYPPCEYANWENGGALQKTAVQTLNVDFVAPCSEVSIYSPDDGWVFSRAMQDANDSMYIYLNDYLVDLGEPDEGLTVEYVGLQYRHLGEGDEGPSAWSPEIPGDSLGSEYTRIAWLPADSLEDGAYELRAFTKCSGGYGYSQNVTGSIDRTVPFVFGNPEPSDGVLSFGEEISVTFSETIDCASIEPDSITLRYLDGPMVDSLIEYETLCDGRTIIISPSSEADTLDGRRLEACVRGITDRAGNPADSVLWEFDYRESLFAWIDSDLTCEAPFGSESVVNGTLVNGTGHPVDFIITEDLSWVSAATPSGGTIMPGETQEIEFTVPGTTERDDYYGEVIATATDTTGAVSVRTLGINLSVTCKPPAWALNPSGFEHSMNLVAELLIEGVLSVDTLDVVAAFIGGELRGVANVDSVHVFDSDTGYDYSWLAFLTVYGNRPSGETVRFQIWDDSDCRLYNSADKSYPFVADSTIGSPDVPETITAADVVGGEVLSIEVHEGWNWISTNVWTPNMSVTNILADLNLVPGDLIKSQADFSQFIENVHPDTFSMWIPSFDLNNVSGYLLNLSQAGTILHTGSPVSVSTTIDVVPGWNWIGYLPAGPMTVKAAMYDLDVDAQNLLTDNDIIKSQDGFAQYVGEEWYGTLVEMEPGRGYKLSLANAGVTGFNYQAYVGSPAEPPVSVASAEAGEEAPEAEAAAEGEQAVAAPDWSVNPYAYQFNMTMTAVLRVDGLESADGRDVIGAFIDGECRGVASPEYIGGIRRYEAFLMIHSNEPSGESVEFRVFDADEGTICGVTEQVDCAADAVVGTVTQPFVLSAVSGEEEEGGVPKAYALGQNVPNPFNPSTTIYYDVPSGGGSVSLRVYDVSGRLVRTLVDGHQAEGSRSVTWDGTGDRGQSIASGIYFYRMTAQGFTETKKMVLLR